MTVQSDEQAEAGDDIDVLYVGSEWAESIVTSLEAASPRLTIATVPDAAKARTELETEVFDCIVAEYELSGESGTSFLSEFSGEQSESPAVLLASEKTEPTAREAVSADISDYFLMERVGDQYVELAECIENAVEQVPERQRDWHRERFEATLEIADTGAWEYDNSTDTLWWSEQARTIHALSTDAQLTPGEIPELYVPEDRRKIRDAFDRAVSQGESFDEILALDTDDERWIRVRGQPVTKGGTVDSVRGSCQDITNLKLRKKQFDILHSAGQQLMQATTREEAAQITIDASKNILGYARAALRLVDENEEVLRVFATTQENLAAAGDRPDYLVDEDVPASRTYRRGQPEVFKDLDTTEDEYERGALRSGLYVPVGNHGVFSCGNLDPDAYDETDVSLVDILTKLTASALTRVESDRELRQKKDQLEEFTSIVAHDLRNPINVISGRIGIARQNPQDEHFDVVQHELERMESIIEDLLTLSRAGKAIDEVESVTLKEAAQEAWQHTPTDGLDVSVEEDEIISADRERLLHIFENLFRNAIDHNEPPVCLTIGLLDEDEMTSGGASATGFFVEDDGSGIPSGERDEVFDQGYTTHEEGTGFGLSIVRHVADAHGWDVELTEGRAGGARFEFANVDSAWDTLEQ